MSTHNRLWPLYWLASTLLSFSLPFWLFNTSVFEIGPLEMGAVLVFIFLSIASFFYCFWNTHKGSIPVVFGGILVSISIYLFQFGFGAFQTHPDTAIEIILMMALPAALFWMLFKNSIQPAIEEQRKELHWLQAP